VTCTQLTPLTGELQVSLHGGRSLTILENLHVTILENLWRGLLGILKTLLSSKDQRKLFVHFLILAVDLLKWFQKFADIIQTFEATIVFIIV